MRKDLRKRVRTKDRLCAACKAAGQCYYGLTELYFDDAAGVMHCRVTCGANHEGGSSVAHGGWICAVMDELLGQHVIERYGSTVTATLTVDFKRPVTIDEPVIGRSWLESNEGRKVKAAGELRLEASGALLATATGLFIISAADHHDRHAAWLREQKAIAGQQDTTA